MKFVNTYLMVFALAYLGHVQSATDYCQTQFCANGQHLGCTNKFGAFASICASNARIITMTASLRQVILTEHNKLRNKIARGDFRIFKPAARMSVLQWDPELAKLARLNVKQCQMKHEDCRKTVKYQYGQNLAYSGWIGLTKGIPLVAKEQVNMWFDENEFAFMTHINSYSVPASGKVIGHFTQVVQDRATHIGCGILRQTVDGWEQQYMACNYSYQNYSNQPVYQRGAAASKCKTGVMANYKFLCSKNEKY